MTRLTTLLTPLLVLSTKPTLATAAIHQQRQQPICANPTAADLTNNLGNFILSRQVSTMSSGGASSSETYPSMGSQGPQEPKSVLGSALALFSQKPMTGYYRDGYCRVGNEDPGNHSVAGIVSEAFLDYTASQGNDLRPVGLSGGCKWCLCSSRWQQALDAFRKGEISKDAVPKIQLNATHDVALKGVKLGDLKEFAA